MGTLIISIVILLSPLLSAARAAEVKGLFSVDNFYSDDASSTQDINLLTTRLRLDILKMNETETLSFHFDGRERNNLGSNDYSSDIKTERIDSVHLEYAGQEKHFYLLFGRMWPKDLPVERVDGINVFYRTRSRIGLALFGGFKPDPYVDDFNTDYNTGGAYISYRKDDSNAGLAFTHNSFKGKTDRQYVYGQSSFSIVKSVRFYGMVTVDINQLTNDMDMTNAIAELSYRSDYGSGIAVGFNTFKAFRLYASMDFEIPDISQESYYVRGDMRLLNRYTLYGRYERQIRHDDTTGAGGEEADLYQAGLRNDNLMKTEISIDMNAAFSDRLNSHYEIYNIEAARFFMEIFQMTLNGSYTKNDYRLFDDDEVYSYGAGGYLILGKRWGINITYDHQDSKNYETSSVFSRISYKF